MAAVEIASGHREPIWVDYYVNNVAFAGSNYVVMAVRRTSDNYRLDFADWTFKSSPGTSTSTLSEDPPGSAHYARDLDTSSFTNAVSDGTHETYIVTVYDVDSGRMLDQHELRLRAIADIQGSQYDANNDSLHDIRRQGDSAWATATGFAVAGDQMNLVNGAITAAKFATNAIDANAVATTAVTEIQSGLATASAVASVSTAVAALPSASTISTQVASDLATAHGAGSWTTATGFAVPGDQMNLANNAISASKIATDAITSSAVASSAVAEIQSGLATAVSLSSLTSDVAAIPTAAEISAQVSSDLATAHGVGSWATATGFAEPGDAMTLADGAITAAKFAIDAIDANALAASAVAEIQSGLATSAALSSVASSVASLPSASANAAAVWGALVASYTGVGTFGALVGTNLDVTVSSRSTLTSGAQMALTSAAITAVQSGLATSSAVAALPTASQISTQVASDLATAHGPGSWATATGFATSSEVGAIQSDVDSLQVAVGALGTAVLAIPTSPAPTASQVAAAVVAEAIAGASAGSVGAALATASGYTIPSASAVASAVWDKDVTGYGTFAQVGTAGGALYGLKVLGFNRMTEAAGNPGTLVVYRDNGSTVYATFQLRDSNAGAITATTGEPAQRAAAS